MIVGVRAWRLLPPPDQRLVCLLEPLLFGAGRVTVATVRDHWPTDEIDYFDESWDFRTFAEAAGAFLSWDGQDQPHGAIRHNGQRIEPHVH